jgi:hypothetical protein
MHNIGRLKFTKTMHGHVRREHESVPDKFRYRHTFSIYSEARDCQTSLIWQIHSLERELGRKSAAEKSTRVSSAVESRYLEHHVNFR